MNFQKKVEIDEIAIDFSKLDKVKQEQDTIYKLFNVSIIYGDKAKPVKTAPISQMTQWLTLTSNDPKARSNAKEYIISLCNPECTMPIEISQDSIKNVDLIKFKENIIQNYNIVVNIIDQVLFNDNNKKVKFELQGRPLKLAMVQSIFDKKLNEFKTESMIQDVSFASSDKDNDIICIDDDDDPYAIFDKEEEQQPKNTNLVENFNEKLNVSPQITTLADMNREQQKPKTQVENKNFYNIALQNGYSKSEVDKVLRGLDAKILNEQQVLQALEFNRKCDECSLSKFSSNKSIINSIAKNEPVSSGNDNKNKSNNDDNDCVMLDQIPARITPNKLNNDKKAGLQEYAKMMHTQKFDNKDIEMENKEKRMSKLAEMMDANGQIEALSNINLLRNKTKSVSPLSLSNLRNASDSPVNNIMQPPKQKIEATQPVNQYNPKLYETKNNNTNDVLFTNFNANEEESDSDDDKNKGQFVQDKNTKNKRKKAKGNAQQKRSSSTTPYSKDTKIQNTNKIAQANRDLTSQIMPTNDGLRPIYIDGSNVAREHGKNKGGTFSCKGIKIVVEYFLKRGHQVEAFVPRFRRGNADKQCQTINPDLLDELDEAGILKYCPSKSYDDRFIVDTAIHHGGVVVSNDQYRDLIQENPGYKDKLRLLEYVFSGDFFMPAQDPLGRHGPKLDEYLSFKPLIKSKNSQSQQNFNSNIKALDLTLTIQNNTNNINNKNNNKNLKKPNQATNIPSFMDVDNLNDFPYANTNNPNISNLHQLKTDGSKYKNYLEAAQSAQMNPIKWNNQNIRQPQQKRNVQQTSELYNKLKDIFPNNDKEISEILNKFPTQFSLEYLTDKLLQRIN